MLSQYTHVTYDKPSTAECIDLTLYISMDSVVSSKYPLARADFLLNLI